MTVQTQLTAVEVKSLDQAQTMRLIRNAGRHDFSHDHAEISAQAQAAWWAEHRGRLHAWLYEVCGTTVGLGMIRELPDVRWVATVAVLPDHRGHGYGGVIMDDLVDQANVRGVVLWSETLLSNPASIKSHRSSHWERTGQDETYAYFRARADSPA